MLRTIVRQGPVEEPTKMSMRRKKGGEPMLKESFERIILNLQLEIAQHQAVIDERKAVLEILKAEMEFFVK